MHAKHIKLENIRENGVDKEVRGFLLFCFVFGRSGWPKRDRNRSPAVIPICPISSCEKHISNHKGS